MDQLFFMLSFPFSLTNDDEQSIYRVANTDFIVMIELLLFLIFNIFHEIQGSFTYLLVFGPMKVMMTF